MQNKCKKFRLWSILLLVMLMAAGFTCHSTSRDVQAATKNGFRTVKGKTYYYKNGKKVKGWLTLNGKKYYFSKSTGVQAKGWVKDKKGRKRTSGIRGKNQGSVTKRPYLLEKRIFFFVEIQNRIKR